jgi:hypothetical protein
MGELLRPDYINLSEGPKPTAESGKHMKAPPLPAAVSFEDLPEGWRVWNDEPRGRAVLVFRPDVFDAEAFPAPCLPTVHVTNGSRKRRPGAGQIPTDEWHAVLLLEPEIEAAVERRDDREAACEAARALAARFSAGDVDYRAHYQVPREAYFERLDELTGREA